MILTKDNLLRYIREKKYVTPAKVADAFETTTMIASAALSELAKDKLVAITYLKLSSSPYYYDPHQKSALIELGEKHFSKYEKEVFIKLKEQQVLNDNSLTIQERLAVERIQDFAKPIEINYSGNLLKFWVWYLRDLTQTKNQILEALNLKDKPEEKSVKAVNIPKQAQQAAQESIRNTNNNFNSASNSFGSDSNNSNSSLRDFSHTTNNNQNKGVVNDNQNNSHRNYDSNFNNQKSNLTHSQNSHSSYNSLTNPFSDDSKKDVDEEEDENSNEIAIENFFKENYLKVEAKQQKAKGIHYVATMKMVNLTVKFDCIFFTKKPTEADVISFYASSQKPKIVFVKNAAKKMLKLSEKLDNLEVVNI